MTGVSEAAAPLERLLFEMKKVIVGQDRLLERIIVALLARGHFVIDGVPGLAKTLTVETLSAAVGGTSSRIQFTPDLIPSDIVGTRIYRLSREGLIGVAFVLLVLAAAASLAWTSRLP